MKKILFIFLLLKISLVNVFSNTIGGDITWTCNGTGDYIFQLRLHVQCGGPALPVNQTLNIFNLPGLNSVSVALLSQTDISPTCTNGNPITCLGGGPGAVAEYLYRSAPITLPGIPPPGGWIITFSDCCRPNSNNLQLNSGTGLTLYSKIFPLFGNPANPCIDSSPDFFSSPQTIFCTGLPTTFNIMAYDSDGDSISVKWAEPLNAFTGLFTPPSNPAPIVFTSGFSFNNPFPGPSQGAGNIAANLNNLSGNISFTNQISGDYSYAVIVESWRCGIKIAEVFKEFQLIFTNCGYNPAPVISIPFSGSYQTSVVAGNTVNFTLTATDFLSQTITWNIFGNGLGTGFSNANTGCSQAPCATLNPAPPAMLQGSNSINFSWQTDCGHLGLSATCPVSEKTYRFYFTAKDDSCPVPGFQTQCLLITVTAPPVLASPEIKCVSVSTGNDLTLTWEIPPDPNNTFHHYTIYSASSLAGPFDSLTSIFNYAQNQLTIPAGANVLNNFYFIRSFACGGYVAAPPIDTVRPILLTVNNPANGTAQLFWNDFAQPLPATSCHQYKIFKEYPAGTWTLIDSTSGNSYSDTITICQAQINYRVEMCDQTGCISVSTIDGDLFFDQIDPITPQLDSVSIDNSGNAILGWTPSYSGDVVAYIVYQRFGTLYVPIDTVFGISSVFFNYLNSNADAGSETFVIAALDSCGNISNLGLPQSTLFLSLQYDVCNYSVNLSWNPYLNMTDGGLNTYEILVSVNGSSFSWLTSTGSTFFVHDSLQAGSTYCYRIRARSAGGAITSISNRECITATAPNQPSFFYLKRVTVNTVQQVEIDGYIDNTTGVAIAGIELYRASAFTGPYQLISTSTYSGNANFTITDLWVDPSEKPYHYYLRAKDSCGNPGIKTDTSTTIWCKAEANEDFTNTISWTEYRKWLGGVNTYAIYRSVNGIFNPVAITTVLFTGAGNYQYIDNVEAFTPEEGKFDYVVEAEEGAGNTYGFIEHSQSNRSTVYQEATIFVPNAFVPKGFNKIFLPITQFVSKSDYHFQIFNRWGQLIWETNDDETGWDGGNDDGGVYIWEINYKNARGEYIDKTGKVVLIR